MRPKESCQRFFFAVALACGVFAGTQARAAGARDIATHGSQVPAFTEKQLSAYPQDGWITNGGSLSNQRYSPLSLINRDNVAQLKARWRASLNGSGLNPRAGNQAQPIVYEGVIYIMTGDGDAFAVEK